MMHARRRFCVALAMCWVGTQAASAQQPASPPAPGIATEPQKSITVTGSVRHFTHAATGDVDGFVLDDGTTIHFPAYLSRQVTALVSEKARVRVAGLLLAGSDADAARLLEARTITDLRSNRTLTVTGTGSAQPGSAVSGDDAAGAAGTGGAAAGGNR